MLTGLRSRMGFKSRNVPRKPVTTGFLNTRKKVIVYRYDPAGNLQTVTTITDSGTTIDDRNPAAHPINNLNQIVGRVVAGVTWTYSYDLNGNLIGKTNGTATWTYTWSDENRLTRVQGPGVDVSYTYDSIGRMLTRTQSGVVTGFTWDGWTCVREVTAGANTVYHIPDGTLHSFVVAGKVYQCHLDALGSVRMITNEAGAVVARWEYGAWGEEVFASVSPVLAGFAYRFVGGLGVRTDSVTGLVYMRNRWYDPGLMRFVSRDPIGLRGGENCYVYAGNRPTNAIDPTGTVVMVLGFGGPAIANAIGAIVAALGSDAALAGAGALATASVATAVGSHFEQGQTYESGFELWGQERARQMYDQAHPINYDAHPKYQGLDADEIRRRREVESLGGGNSSTGDGNGGGGGGSNDGDGDGYERCSEQLKLDSSFCLNCFPPKSKTQLQCLLGAMDEYRRCRRDPCGKKKIPLPAPRGEWKSKTFGPHMNLTCGNYNRGGPTPRSRGRK